MYNDSYDYMGEQGVTRKTTIMEFMFSRIKFVDGGCWEWWGTRLQSNYGVVRYQGRYQLVHRVVYRFFKGKIKDGMLVCHTCDNPPCCNPDHLFQGTHQDNSDDMIAKGRQFTGYDTRLPKHNWTMNRRV